MQVIVVPLLCGLTGRGVKPVTWASAAIAFLGMGLLEGGGAQGEIISQSAKFGGLAFNAHQADVVTSQLLHGASGVMHLFDTCNSSCMTLEMSFELSEV